MKLNLWAIIGLTKYYLPIWELQRTLKEEFASRVQAHLPRTPAFLFNPVVV